jgi:hypothetical protein
MEDVDSAVQNRNLNQWNLLVAALFGSFAGYSFFNQSILNLVLKRVMSEYIMPYLAARGLDSELREKLGNEPDLESNVREVVEFFNELYSMNAQIEVSTLDNGSIQVEATASRCGLCPVGVGRAQLKEGDTLCPFPQLFLTAINSYAVEDKKVSLHKTLRGAKTTIVKKEEGLCKIVYDRVQPSTPR